MPRRSSGRTWSPTRCTASGRSAGGGRPWTCWLGSRPTSTRSSAAATRSPGACVTGCGKLGRSVPGDVAVTGFDDWDVMALASRPPLTTVDLRLEELGRVAGQALLALIDGGTASSAAVTPSLVIRESTVGA
ncbi:substrate-binding domain-containing protein [Curtobacterium flaccumfaciens]